MRCYWLALLLVTSALSASDEEAFALRRIGALWSDQEYRLVKKEIHNFFRTYPASDEMERLQAVLGDASTALREWDAAIEAYHEVVTIDLYKKVFPNLIKAHYELEEYDRVLELAERFMPDLNVELESDAQQAAALFWSQVQTKRKKWYDAEPVLLRLLATPFREPAQLALAELYRETERPQRAARVYKELAQQRPAHRETFLYQAAQLERQGGGRAVIETLRQVQSLKGERANDAAWQEVVLLVDEGDHEAIIRRFPALQPLLSPERALLFSFYHGRSLILTDQYRDGTIAIENFAENGASESAFHQAALLLGVGAAGKIGDLGRVERWTSRFEQLYSNEPELPKILFLRAMANKTTGHYLEAVRDLDRIVTEFPEFADRDDAAFERALALYEQENYRVSRDAFLAFVEEYPDSDYRSTCYQYVVAASLKILEDIESGEERGILADQVTEDLEMAFAGDDPDSLAKKGQYLLRLASANVQMERYEEAIPLLETFFKDYPEHEDSYQALLLMATCYRVSRNDLPAYVHFSEQALTLKPGATAGNRTIRRNLFAAYVKLGEWDEAARPEYMNKAEELLQGLYREEPSSIEREHLVWLAERVMERIGFNPYLAQTGLRVDEGKLKLAQEAVTLMEAAFGRNFTISEETLYMEGALVKWANLLGWLGRMDEQKLLLEQLVLVQQANPDWKWRFADGELLSLASLYIQNNQLEEASDLLEQLRENRRLDKRLEQQVRLLWARITYQRLPPELRHRAHYRVKTVLEELHQLQAQRKIEQEPLHLEAAIDHAAMEAALVLPGEQTESLLSNLQKVKEDFSQQDDFVAKDYHTLRADSPDKDRIYQAYMMLVDAQIAYAQFLIAKKNGDEGRGRRRLEAAATIFETLAEGKFAVSRYLVDQAQWALKSMREGRSPLVVESGSLSPGGEQ